MRTTHYQCDGLRSKRTLEHSSSPPSSARKKSNRFDYSFFIIKNIFIAIFNDILLPFDIEIIRETFYNLSRNKFENDDENADIHLCFTRKI